MLDKTMIGSITQSSAQNGYYEQSEKIVKMCLMLVTALPTVLLPKVSKAYAEKRLDDAKQYLYKAYNFVWFLGTPLMFGVMGISTVLVPIFFGKGYEAVIYILPVMSLLFITMGLNQTSGTQFFIASGRQN
jgi:Membrane protein involved in the export of O-antigen and teichoic acid